MSTGNQDPRTLNLQFEPHVEKDVDFKIGLITMMIVSIRELEEAAYKGYDQKDVKVYHGAEHKARSTVRLLNDREFETCIRNLGEALSAQHDADSLKAVDQFRLLADSIIRSLEQTLHQLRKN